MPSLRIMQCMKRAVKKSGRVSRGQAVEAISAGERDVEEVSSCRSVTRQMR